MTVLAGMVVMFFMKIDAELLVFYWFLPKNIIFNRVREVQERFF